MKRKPFETHIVFEYENGAVTCKVLHRCQRYNLYETMLKTVIEFLKTDEGEKRAISNGGDFNWGDAYSYVPTKFWRRHNLSFKVNPADMVFDHDENIWGEMNDRE